MNKIGRLSLFVLAALALARAGADARADGNRSQQGSISATARPLNADNSGKTDARASIQAAVDFALANGRAQVDLAAGTYLIGGTRSLDGTSNGIVIPWNGGLGALLYGRIVGLGAVTFKHRPRWC